MSKSHEARVALITGAAGGLGGHFARRLADEGCRLVLVDRELPAALADELRQRGTDVYAEAFDLSDAEAIAQFSAHVLEGMGRCDIVINNGAHMPLVPFAELDLNAFRQFQRVNVEAPLLFARAFTPGMSQRGWGRFVQIASSTIGTPMPDFAGYITTKMAGIGLTRALAAEFGNQGITFNSVCPGLTRTESSEKHLPKALFEHVRMQQIIQRTEEPADLCGIIAFLTSDDAAFITGQNFFVDGGVNF